jgi:hypothetical protein
MREQPREGGMSIGMELHHTDIGIGGLVVRLTCADRSFLESLETRYRGFIGNWEHPDFEFQVELHDVSENVPDEDVTVSRKGALWLMRRGDFRAEWNPDARTGRIRQSANPYSLDSVLRIVHTLVLAKEGGRLMHASSAVCKGRAVLFSGVSGVGKTTMSRLAPPDVQLLTDEMSFVRREENGYFAFGTPFAGDLAKPGDNIRAPLRSIYLLRQGPENRIEELPMAERVRGILANTLFFAQDPELVQAVFASAVDLAAKVPVRRLTFLPDARVWDLIGNEL